MERYRYLPDKKSLKPSLGEVLRYMRAAGSGDGALIELAERALEEATDCAEPKAEAVRFEVKSEFSGGRGSCDFGFAVFESAALAKLLSPCRYAYIFGATLGIETDRRIARLSNVQPSKALALDAAATALVETLCDGLCAAMEAELCAEGRENGRVLALTRRFSPGYGDLDLSVQKQIFSELRLQKNIGLTLTESLLMLPSKSVTAITGVLEYTAEEYKELRGAEDARSAGERRPDKCRYCGRKDCEFRSGGE